MNNHIKNKTNKYQPRGRHFLHPLKRFLSDLHCKCSYTVTYLRKGLARTLSHLHWRQPTPLRALRRSMVRITPHGLDTGLSNYLSGKDHSSMTQSTSPAIFVRTSPYQVVSPGDQLPCKQIKSLLD
jgi:hypothetical protein